MFSEILETGLLMLNENPKLALACSFFGFLYLASCAWSVFRFLNETFILPGKKLADYGAKTGRWAVITGATDGIGQEFALQLAKAGFNILIASRTQAKLDVVAADIETSYKVQTKTFAIDFSKHDNKAAWDALATVVNTIDVGVLVNNVGLSHDIPTYFHQVEDRENDDIIEVNIRAALKITKMIIPLMLAKKSGLILNLGSVAGMVPSPMLATYSGSKAFLSTWSQALAEEYRSQGIIVELLNTYFVVSAMSKIKRPSIMIPTAKAYVKSALGKIGVPCGSVNVTATSTPYWSHAFLVYVISLVNLPGIPISYSHVLHQDIRRRALRKRERESAAGKAS